MAGKRERQRESETQAKGLERLDATLSGSSDRIYGAL